ncbi:peptidoglycan-binding domain-containing protein [Actinosynnema sp. CS-041913]|uniref:peptidoglycan-binding domain-containing protein n=1 Tax=Actinosynnema sp. CS-041913 TaxID=3239917 RepID=UPI003D8C4CD4
MAGVKARAELGAASGRRSPPVVASARPSRPGPVGRDFPGPVGHGVPAERLLAVQKAVGNRAFTRAVQRVPAAGGGAACAPPLEHSRFAGNTRLQSAARNSPPLGQSERGDPVKALQQALHDLGPPFLMPKTMRTGAPDGVWGDETRTAVRTFQERNGIPPGGHEAGLRTLTKLDCVYRAKEPPKDDTLDPGEVPGRMSAATTKPAAADSKGTVKQRPEGKVSLDTATALPAKEDKEPLVKGEVAIGGQLLLATTEKDHKPKLCDFAQVEVSGLVNYRVLRLGDRVVIGSEPTLSLDLLPSLCQDRHEFPTLKLQLDVLKVMISEQVEVALAAGAGVKDAFRQPRGWLETGITLGIGVGKLHGIPVKIELGINGELPIARDRKPDGSFDDHAEVHFVGGFVFF